jgi:cytochrome P450
MKSRVDETLAQIEAEHGPNPGPYVLANSAYLQSLFSETLRLYSADTVLRGPSLRDTRIGNWVVPRGKFMGISSYGRHHDENYWNTGTEEKAHSLDEFWDERFLVSEKRNLRGPSKDPASSGAHSDAAMDAELSIGRVSDKDLKFSTDGLAGSYLPFGGGDTICPGRAFAKMEIISTVVYLLKNYEIELLAGRPKFNSGTFGIGVLSPEGTTPVMIKKM